MTNETQPQPKCVVRPSQLKAAIQLVYMPFKGFPEYPIFITKGGWAYSTDGHMCGWFGPPVASLDSIGDASVDTEIMARIGYEDARNMVEMCKRLSRRTADPVVVFDGQSWSIQGIDNPVNGVAKEMPESAVFDGGLGILKTIRLSTSTHLNLGPSRLSTIFSAVADCLEEERGVTPSKRAAKDRAYFLKFFIASAKHSSGDADMLAAIGSNSGGSAIVLCMPVGVPEHREFKVRIGREEL